VDTSPTLTDCLCFLRTALGVARGTQWDSQLHVMISIVRLASCFGSWTWRHLGLQRCQCDESSALCVVATPSMLDVLEDEAM
jgi:hypothetical protein